MLLRKTAWFRKRILVIISLGLIFSISGCSNILPEETVVSETVRDVQSVPEESEEAENEMISLCIDLYEKAEEENKSADLETIRSIVNRFGENGYSAVDSKNQIDMTEPEQVLQFCESVNAKQEVETTIWEVGYDGGLAKYVLKTKDGVIDVVRKYFEYQDGSMQEKVTEEYSAESWKYTEEGYLMFSGSCASEEQYVLSLKKLLRQ